MKLEVHNRCTDFNSYRAARVKSLFNAESGANFDLTAELPIDDPDWRLGVIVGPSGSGKTSLGRLILGADAFYEPTNWPVDAPIIDGVAPGGDFNDVTAALGAVGLGTVPTWLRPYHVLSNGEKFRADLARIISEAPARVVVDEFTSVVDRQIAKFGALAFAKAWKRTGGQCVLLSCHYDILDWLEPDWVFDTRSAEFQRGSLWRRPKFDLEILETSQHYWPLFKPHHYLDLPWPVNGHAYIGLVDGEPVAHLCMATANAGKGRFEGRGTRLVVMPEWQGAGVGMRFLNAVCQMWLDGNNQWGKPVTTMFHTSHPGLCAGLRRDPRWRQISAELYGVNRKKSARTLHESHERTGASHTLRTGNAAFGGHLRAVQGFRYYGPKAGNK